MPCAKAGVTFERDRTLPEWWRQIQRCRNISAGVSPEAVERIVSHAVEVEQDVAIHFDAIAAVASDCSSQEVEKSFRQLAEFSRLHLAAVKSRAGNVDVSLILRPRMSGTRK
jgi:hypothetical protein